MRCRAGRRASSQGVCGHAGRSMPQCADPTRSATRSTAPDRLAPFFAIIQQAKELYGHAKNEWPTSTSRLGGNFKVLPRRAPAAWFACKSNRWIRLDRFFRHRDLQAPLSECEPFALCFEFTGCPRDHESSHMAPFCRTSPSFESKPTLRSVSTSATLRAQRLEQLRARSGRALLLQRDRRRNRVGF